ncbi:hypothetical protein RRG08_013639 [Elysia crispata]|uniref:Alpha-ketoglutarate-dependent dioxygenase AlkB-like domain-containing protein n=1 Tax=Elysia crispata TaxID=231223 RepID=A0AAE1DS55_9GAST|nr:hypothetical protein RRG08_013639 [Elysia crispata]
MMIHNVKLSIVFKTFFSIFDSFGQTAIFLLGGKTKSVEPVALYLRSGDICVMSGPSRLAYHAIPRILLPWSTEEVHRLRDVFDYDPTVFPENVCGTSLVRKIRSNTVKVSSSIQTVDINPSAPDDISCMQPFIRYLSASRINLNIRQVFPLQCNSSAADKA